MLRAAKDKIASRGIRAHLNQRFARYGVIRHLAIDSRRKRIEITAVLRGEVDPVGITITDYAFERIQGSARVQVRACACTRPWLQHLMEDLVCGRPIEVPRWAAMIL